MRYFILATVALATVVVWRLSAASPGTGGPIGLSPEEHSQVASTYTEQVLLGSVYNAIHRDPSNSIPDHMQLSADDAQTLEVIATTVPKDFEAKYADHSPEEIRAAFLALRSEFGQVKMSAFRDHFEAGNFQVIGVAPVGQLPNPEEFTSGTRLVCFRQHDLGGGLIEHRRVVLEEAQYPELYALQAEMYWLNARSSPVYRAEDLATASHSH